LNGAANTKNQIRAQRTFWKIIVPTACHHFFAALHRLSQLEGSRRHVILAVAVRADGGVFLQWFLGTISAYGWVGYIALLERQFKPAVVMVVYLQEAPSAKKTRETWRTHFAIDLCRP